MLAEVKKIPEEECARITTENFFRLFDKAKPAMKVTILGCGSSGGVPLVGCKCCEVCASGNPKNNRTRVSLYIEINDYKAT
jgi:hypothetical protein